MSDPIEECARALLDRLQRELGRDGPSTATVGGYTKAGNAVELLLKLAAADVLAASGGSLDRELRSQRLAAGAGTYARLLATAQPQASSHPIVRGIIVDVRNARASRVRQFIEKVRNPNTHPGAGPREAKRAMRELAAWLRPLLR